MQSDVRDTLPRSAKGPAGPAPALVGPIGAVADTVADWPGISSSVHWSLFDQSHVDGVDFYLGEEELGHLHLDGSIHLATSAELGAALVEEGLAEPFRYNRGWVEAHVPHIGVEASVALFRRNHDYLLKHATVAETA